MNDYFKILDESWDILIILDACRYDYFKNCYSSFLEGTLEKRLSIGACTPEWRNKNFSDYRDDIVYISSNPYISGSYEVEGFDARKHFFKVIDVWQTNWDSKYGTVRPEPVSDAAISAASQYQGKKLIVHYLQPHAPYLSIEGVHGFSTPDTKTSDPFQLSKSDSNGPNKFKYKLLSLFSRYKNRFHFFSDHPEWYFAQLLGLPPQTPMDYMRRKHGVKALQDAYNKNLEIALNDVAYLVSQLPDNLKIVISSDHGELLGENRKFSHSCGSHHETLRTVPWFTVSKTLKDSFPDRISTQKTQADDVCIENKLKNLGYL